MKIKSNKPYVTCDICNKEEKADPYRFSELFYHESGGNGCSSMSLTMDVCSMGCFIKAVTRIDNNGQFLDAINNPQILGLTAKVTK